MSRVSTSRMSIYALIEPACDILSKLVCRGKKGKSSFRNNATFAYRVFGQTVFDLPSHYFYSTRKIYAYVTNIVVFVTLFGRLQKCYENRRRISGCSSVNDLRFFEEDPHMRIVSRECRVSQKRKCTMRCDTRAIYVVEK